MGSGAFLVEACRQLADHLVVAWQRHGGMPPVPPDEDELLLAKRLVAQKCLYGVDKNPMAADLAKLSLWLATLAKDHPFTFLDHSLRSGDSLVGLGRKQIASLHWEEKAQRTTVTKSLEDAIRRAAASRRDILEGGDFLSPALKAQKLDIADDALSKPRLIGDAVIAAFFSAAKPKDRQKTLDRLAEPVEDFLSGKGDYVAARAKIADLTNWVHGKPRDPAMAAGADDLAPAEPISHPLTPFHWEIEFPEVFQGDNPGFDAIVGNPPFVGGRRIRRSLGDAVFNWVTNDAGDVAGNADLCAHFFLRAFSLLGKGCTFGLIATNTISQGDTRTCGLRTICTQDGSIFSAIRRLRWPGEAAVTVSVIHVAKGSVATRPTLDGQPVDFVSAFLFPRGGHDNPAQLADNDGKAFQGSIALGMGFTFDDTADADDVTAGTPIPLATMASVLSSEPHSQERIFPYLGGEELNDHPNHLHHRYVISFFDMPEAECRTNWPALMKLIETKVKPERRRTNAKGEFVLRSPLPERWWQHADKRPALFAAMRGRDRVLAHSFTSKYLQFAFVPTSTVVAGPHCVFVLSTYAAFSALQCSLHDTWVQVTSSTLEDRLSYKLSDSFETFPFPENFESDAGLEAAGREYYEYRAALMVKNDEGLTKTYNRFHDPAESSPEIARLRELHAAMDRAVLDAYGWVEVPTACGFALDWLDLDDDELAETLASAPDDIRERIESAHYFFATAAEACRFQAHIKQSGKSKLPWRYRWPDDVRDDILARLLALNAKRAELERLTGLPGATPSRAPDSATAEDANSTAAPPAKAKRAKKASKRATKKSAPRPMFDDPEP